MRNPLNDANMLAEALRPRKVPREVRVEMLARKVAREGEPKTQYYGCEGTPSSGPYVAERPALVLDDKFKLVRQWPHWLLVTPTTIDILNPNDIAALTASKRLEI